MKACSEARVRLVPFAYEMGPWDGGRGIEDGV